jgi:putative membrane protein
MLALAFQWVLSAVSVVVVSKLLPGFRVKHFGTALIVAALYGILQVLLYKILKIIFILPMLLTFGLFALVINAFLLFLTDKLLSDFDLDSLWTTLIGAILLTLINGFWGWLFF